MVSWLNSTMCMPTWVFLLPWFALVLQTLVSLLSVVVERKADG